MSSSLAVSSGGGGGGDYSSPSASSRRSKSGSSGNSGSRGLTRIDVETIRLHASSFVARLGSRVSLETLRPLPMFLGVNPNNSSMWLAAGAFTPPVRKVDKSSLEKIKSRLGLNFQFFLTNYVLLASMVALVVALMHPGMLFFVALVCGLWSCHRFLIRNELILFGINVHSLLSIQQRFYFLFTVTAVVVVWKCLRPSLTFVTISSLLVFFHAVLRDPKHIEKMGLLEEEISSDDDEEGGGGGNGNNNDANNDNASSGSEVMVETPLLTSRRGDVI